MRIILFVLKVIGILVATDFYVLFFLMLRKDRKFIEEFLDDRFITKGQELIKFGRAYGNVFFDVEYASGINPQDLPLKFIAVSNHQSLFDIPFLFLSFPKSRLRFISKKELGFGLPGISNFLVYQNHLLLDRKKNLRQGSEDIRSFVRSAKDNGYSLVIYPEGTRSLDTQMNPFKTGGLRIFLSESDLPIVCFSIHSFHPAKDFLQTIKSGKIEYKIYVKKIIQNDFEKNRETLNQKIEEIESQIKQGLEFVKENFQGDINIKQRRLESKQDYKKNIKKQ